MIYEDFKKQVENHPHSPALIYQKQTYSWSTLLSLVDHLADAFLQLGLKPGDKVAFYLTNCPEQIISYYACFKMGLTIVPINVRFKAAEVAKILVNCRPNVLISENKLFFPLNNIVASFNFLQHYFLVNKIDVDSIEHHLQSLFDMKMMQLPCPNFSPRQTAIILYTSGTTGEPKGVVHEYCHLQNNIRNQHALIKPTSRDKTLVVLSLCYTFGVLRQLLPAYAAGITVVLMKNFIASEALALIQQYQITLLYAVPTIYWRLVNEMKQLTGFSHSIRCCIASGDAVPLALHQEFRALFGIELCETIAQTETMMYAANPVNGPRKIGSLGLPVPNMQYTILDKTGQELAPDKLGEIGVRGNTLMQGYLNDPLLTAKAYINGWFRTGDLGVMDKEGWLWFRGREKQLIIHNGLNISPQEVEAVLYQHPHVLECAVTGLAHPVHGEIVAACIVAKDPTITDTQILIDFVREHLADYKVPEKIIFVESLPKGMTGKIARDKLVNLFFDSN